MYQMRVVAGQRKSLPIHQRYPVVYMWQGYTQKTNGFSAEKPGPSQSPSGGNVIGRVARELPALDRTLTNRTMSGRDGSAANGFSFSRRMRSRPSQSITSASNDSFRSNAARNVARSEEHTSELQSQS